MIALHQPDLIPVADYLAGEESAEVKHEYLGGVVHAMAGASNRHNTVALNAAASLLARLRGKRCQAFNSDTKIRLELPEQTRFYYPDASVVCQPNPPTDRFQDRPVLVLEVLSDSTRRVDLGEKREAYLAIPSLKILLFAESELPAVTLHRRRPEGGFAAEVHRGLDAVVPLPEIEAELPLVELYERVEFD